MLNDYLSQVFQRINFSLSEEVDIKPLDLTQFQNLTI